MAFEKYKPWGLFSEFYRICPLVDWTISLSIAPYKGLILLTPPPPQSNLSSPLTP